MPNRGAAQRDDARGPEAGDHEGKTLTRVTRNTGGRALAPRGNQFRAHRKLADLKGSRRNRQSAWNGHSKIGR